MLRAEVVATQGLLLDNIHPSACAVGILQYLTTLPVKLLQARYQQASEVELELLRSLSIRPGVDLCQRLQANVALADPAWPRAEQPNDVLIDFVEGAVAVEKPEQVLRLFQEPSLEFLSDHQARAAFLVQRQPLANPGFCLGPVDEPRDLYRRIEEDRGFLG